HHHHAQPRHNPEQQARHHTDPPKPTPLQQPLGSIPARCVYREENSVIQPECDSGQRFLDYAKWSTSYMRGGLVLGLLS
ncbi:hypothetical protein ACIPJK_39700, partial [Streptomyces roseus]|uniref:hypothetical protein n=1 Tax=Streptomyces roseus TaxID=66430 RepID=UPI003825E720